MFGQNVTSALQSWTFCFAPQRWIAATRVPSFTVDKASVRSVAERRCVVLAANDGQRQLPQPPFLDKFVLPLARWSVPTRPFEKCRARTAQERGCSVSLAQAAPDATSWLRWRCFVSRLWAHTAHRSRASVKLLRAGLLKLRFASTCKNASGGSVIYGSQLENLDKFSVLTRR